jgi:hypothetical protein
MWNESDESAFEIIRGMGQRQFQKMGLCLVFKYIGSLDSNSVSVWFTGESTGGCSLPVPTVIGSNRSDSILIAYGMRLVDINPKSCNKRVQVFVFNIFLWIIADYLNIVVKFVTYFQFLETGLRASILSVRIIIKLAIIDRKPVWTKKHVYKTRTGS